MCKKKTLSNGRSAPAAGRRHGNNALGKLPMRAVALPNEAGYLPILTRPVRAYW